MLISACAQISGIVGSPEHEMFSRRVQDLFEQIDLDGSGALSVDDLVSPSSFPRRSCDDKACILCAKFAAIIFDDCTLRAKVVAIISRSGGCNQEA